MSRLFEEDIDPSPILGKRIAVVGYGNQGRAHALNLVDRGLEVVIGARPGIGLDQALEDGFGTKVISEAVKGADIVLLSVPDETMKQVFYDHLGSNLAPNCLLVFAHGFAVTYGLVDWKGSLGLVSPAGPGTSVRSEFLAGRGVPGFFGVRDESDLPLVLAYAWAIGCARGGVVRTTFKEETECDLFGEQTVLCGGMPELATAAFDILVESGYSPTVAYTECVAQVRLLAELMEKYGIAGMKERISDTAEWGSYQVGPKVIGKETRAAMRVALGRIQSGEFAREWIAEASSGKKKLLQLRGEQAYRSVEVESRERNRDRSRVE